MFGQHARNEARRADRPTRPQVRDAGPKRLVHGHWQGGHELVEKIVGVFTQPFDRVDRRPSGTMPVIVELIANYRKSWSIGGSNRRRSGPTAVRF